ncbi:glutamine--fructose-6-phosphate transaminase (isomerizing) [Candidatus Micrarchaeota archaeon]|nr:glutamine--fructose-6-phosphate transaminase (isomerizing) [Candidatus Micrarchaeota archaeon]
MCGIIGLLKLNESDSGIHDIVEGLKRLEYRGYDSWGYASINSSGIVMEKKIGRITKATFNHPASIIIGHTRWATHGNVTEANAHPHLDCNNQIAIVHNGIIENYLELREQLIKEGHTFKSQTDSEVVTHLFEKLQGDLFERAKQIAPMLRGSFSLVIMDARYSDQLVAIKNESPLAIGIAEKEAIFASDPLAFIDQTDDAIFLTEGDIALAKKSGNKITFEFFNYLTNNSVTKQSTKLDWKNQKIELGEYKHYMLKEIVEQPVVMRQGMNLDSAQDLANEMHNKKVIAIGCGTARHSAVIGKHILNKIAKFPLEVMMAHEFSYFVDEIDKDTVILAVSQSGETADVMECVRKAKKRGLKIISIVNVPSSSLARDSNKVFYTNCGPEIAVASTKAFSNQILAFYLIAFALSGEIKKQKIESVIGMLDKNISYFDLKAREIAEYLKNKVHVYILGKGVNFPIALEGALKLKEISYIHAEGMPSGELKHGTLALIEHGVPVILICPTDYTYHDSISNGLETKARGAYLIGISDKPHPSFNMWIQLPELSKEDEILYPLLETIPLQLIAYYTALALGRDVDKPRNLAKSVTVK